MKNDRSKGEMGRRDFLNTSALSTTGMVESGMFFASLASAQRNSKNFLGMKSEYGQGPFPSQGMAVYTSDGPLKLMNINEFHKRFHKNLFVFN